ncbi:molecular chaperone DnaK suppressor DksA [Candidatus Dependentiae bacterium Noda2021]|nr:molecular chaperone DnaK suppressor DksA [Candidatus Dependentiae bacterium Noda2021]
MAEAKKKSTQTDFSEIKKDLLARKVELEEELQRLYTEKFSDDQVQDPGDQALTSTMESLRSSLQDSRIEEFHRIVNAIKMIDEGTYGICADCNNPISEKRLKLYPNATRCLSCQELFEEGKLPN